MEYEMTYVVKDTVPGFTKGRKMVVTVEADNVSDARKKAKEHFLKEMQRERDNIFFGESFSGMNRSDWPVPWSRRGRARREAEKAARRKKRQS
jgi:hypothetical protein